MDFLFLVPCTAGIGKDCYLHAAAVLHAERAHTFGCEVSDSFLIYEIGKAKKVFSLVPVEC